MKERSLVERIIAILGVLAKTVTWVARLMWSLLRGALKQVRSAGANREAGGADGVRQAASGAVEKGRAATEGVKQRVNEAMQRGSGDEADEDDAMAQFSTESANYGMAQKQHEDVGGIPPAPRMGNVAAANLSTMGSVYEESGAEASDDDDEDVNRPLSGNVREVEELGGTDQDVYGSEAGSLLDTDEPVTDYAGYAKSESDVGVDRSSHLSEIASSPDNDLEGGVDTYDVVDAEETGSDEDEDVVEAAHEQRVPAAGRGWQEPEDPLAGDPLYGDVESSGTGGEVDLRNDEAGDEAGSGMHVVSAPNEPFIDDEPATQDLGLSGVVEEAGVEPTLSDDESIDDVTNLESTAIDETMLAADATGRRIGGDPASGDLGPETSFDDTERNVIESREPGEVVGAYGGSGVDDFLDDEVASDLLQSADADVSDETDGPVSGSDESASDNGSGGGAGSDQDPSRSVAWATSAGVVDPNLTKPEPESELQTGSDMSQTEAEGITDADDDPGPPGSRKEVRDEFMVDGSESEAVKAPQYDQPQDAGLRAVAAEMAEDMDVDDFKTGNPPGDVGQGAADRSTSQGSAADAPAGAIRGDGSRTCPSDFPIKASGRSRVYHRPSDSSYEDTIPKFCFATEEDAKAAGFRPRKS